MSNRIIEANYIQSKVKIYRGIPFIEALDPIMTVEQAHDALSFAPDLPTKRQKSLPKHLRIHELQTLRLLVRPLNDYIDLEQKFAMMLRAGYISRNLSPDNWRLTYAFAAKRDRKTLNALRIDNSAYGLLIYGLSGDGKTTLKNRILAQYPEAIIHKDLDGPGSRWTQIVYINVGVPPGGSLIGLCQRILREIARIVGEPQLTAHRRTAKVSEHLDNIASLVRKYFIGVIVIDDLQHLKEANPAHRLSALNFLTDLIEIAGVPVLCVGTYAVERLFWDAFKSARKVGGLGLQQFYHPSSADDSQWIDLVHFIWKYQWLKTYRKLTKPLIDELFVQSMGITDVLIKLYLLVQMYAILGDDDERITVPLIRDVANRDLHLLQPALNILRRARLDAMRPEDAIRFDDLFPIGEWFDEAHTNAIRRGLGEREIKKGAKTAKEGAKNIKRKNKDTTTSKPGLATADLRTYIKSVASAYEDMKASHLVISDYRDID